ncbi:MAG: hypothetical protein V1495_02760 [Pseudomonadota bacterium]
MYFQRAWAAAAIGLLACSTHSPSSSPSSGRSGGPVRVALSVAPGTLAVTADDLAARLAASSGHKILPVERTGATGISKVEVSAADRGAAALLTLAHPTGEPGSFVLATIRSIETGELIAETAVPRDTTSSIVSGISDWYVTVAPKLNAIPPLSELAFVRRLAEKGNCSDVASFLSRHELNPSEARKEANDLSEGCTSRSTADSGASGVPLQIRTENVSASYRNFVSDRVSDSAIVRELQTFYNKPGELRITCDENCRQGTIRFLLPFDAAWYREKHLPKTAPLSPYKRLAKALLEYRNLLRGRIPISDFPLELDLTTRERAFAIDILGTADRPELLPRTDPAPFFAVEP